MSDAGKTPPPPPPPGSGSVPGAPAPHGAFPPPPPLVASSAPRVPGSIPAPASGAVSNDETTMAVLIHVLLIFTGFIGPLIIWLIKKDDSPFVDRHGRTALNFAITLTIAVIASAVLILVLIGLLFLAILMVAGFVLPIIAAVKAGRGEEYTYPLTIKFLG